MKKRLLTSFIAGLFLVLISLNFAIAADYVETFDTNVIASGAWIEAQVGSPDVNPENGYAIWEGKFLVETYESTMIYYYNNATAFSWTNYEIVVPQIKTSINNFGAAGAGVTFRVQNKDNFYYAVLHNEYWSGDEVQVGKCIGGICAPITGGTTAFAVNLETSYKLKVSVVGDRIKVYVNDNLKVDVTDNTIFPGGTVGIFSGGLEVVGVTWDEFQVTFIEPFIDIGLRVYDGTSAIAIAIACEPQGTLTSPLRISKNWQTYGIALVELTDPMASKIRIKTSSGIKALRKFN